MSENQIILREATAPEIADWDALVKRFANHRVMHTRGWIGSLEDSVRGKPLFLIYERAGEIVGCLPGMLTKIGVLRVFGSPLPGWQTRSMGPTFDAEKITTEELIAPLAPFLEKRYGVHHIELMTHTLDGEFMKKSGFRCEPKPIYRVPLHPEDEERVLKNMKQNARNRVKKGIKFGLIPKILTNDESFVEEIYDQLVEVYARGGNRIPYGKRRVEAFFRRMKKAGNLLAVGVYLPDDETCIATGLFIIDDDKELILWSWTHRTEYRQFNPTELLTWTAMREAMRRGCKSLPLGGGGDYKAKFGAEIVDTKFRYVRSRYKWMLTARDLAEKCYRWQQSLRGNLAGNKKSAAQTATEI